MTENNNIIDIEVKNQKNFYGTVAAAAYDYPFKNTINGFKLVPEYSDNDSSLFKRGNRYILSVKGTTITDPKNIVSDVLVFFGKIQESEDYRALKSKLDRIIKEINYDSLTLVGHSLGGALVIQAFKDYSKHISRVFAYNFAASFKQAIDSVLGSTLCALPVIRRFQTCKKRERVKIYTTGSDPISILSRLDSRTELARRTEKDPHTIRNFMENLEGSGIDNKILQNKNIFSSNDKMKVESHQKSKPKRKANAWATFVSEEYKKMKKEDASVMFKDVLKNPDVKAKYHKMHHSK